MSIDGFTNSDIPAETRSETVGGFTYIGEAVPGSSDADPVWRIQRMGPGVTTRWADKNSVPNKVWDSGASEYLSYTYV